MGTAPKQQKMKIVSVRPYCSPDPNDSKYEQCYQHKLMLHVPFRDINQLKGTYETFSEVYKHMRHFQKHTILILYVILYASENVSYVPIEGEHMRHFQKHTILIFRSIQY